MIRALLKLLLLPLVIPAAKVSGQQIAVKTDALYWATTTPNIGVELAVGRKITIDFTGSYNPWTFGSAEANKKIQHWLVRPEVRFWPYESWDGHFLGVHALFASYNAGGIDLPVLPLKNLNSNRYEGYTTGVGFSYGYQWYLGRRWNLELTAGLGYLYFNYDRYDCRKCGDLLERTHKHWFGPTRVGLSFLYLLKSKR